jgi:amino acid adenylation domain-containing protein/FkbM family methyltransferase
MTRGYHTESSIGLAEMPATDRAHHSAAAPRNEVDRHRVLVEWNDTAKTYPGRDLCLHQLIEKQASKTPNQLALAFEQATLTYGEMNRRADALAHYLRGLGVGPEVLVGLFVERSLEMVVSIIAILKAGGAYVPIDAAYPKERVEYMLADANVKGLITQSSLLENVPSHVSGAVYIDTFDWYPSERPIPDAAAVCPKNLAYVIYTSGSTGKPKGVCIQHRNIVNYVLGVADRLEIQPGMNHATVSTIAADLGNTVIFPALATGGCLHIISQVRAENQAALAEYVQREKIDVLKIVPSHLAALQSAKNPEQVMPRRRLILGGESSRLEWIERLHALAPTCEIYNHYGPTETTVGILTYHVNAELPSLPSGKLPLGRPLSNSRVYILDDDRQPVPVGIAGELYIGGDGVGRGYLNRPDLTTEKFIADPFHPDGFGRLYRTGDVARYLPDGNIEFCGRMDDQVKIHGYRVELGEIEAALREQPGVKEALVLASEDESGSKQLAAYVVPTRATPALWNSMAQYILPDGCPIAHLNKNETDYIYHEIFALQAYLRHGITLRDGDCIVDAGANIGLFTVFVSRLVRGARILAFEPNPAAYACLKANSEAWGQSVKCLPVGLARENGSAELTFFEGLSLLSGFYTDPVTEREVVRNYVFNQEAEFANNRELTAEVGALIDDRMQTKRISAQLRTLSSVIAEENIEQIDLLKINVEKSELDVLMGLSERDWAKVRQLVIEVDLQQNLDPITTLLKGHGFETIVEQDPLLQQTALCYVYAIRPSVEGPHLVREQPADAHVRSLPAVNGQVLVPAILRKRLQERLPKYMVPPAFVLMERFPLTKNGKIDRASLRSFSIEHKQATHDFIRPRNETETALLAVWAELLKANDFGIDDDFFDLGGDSLLAIKAVSRIRDTFEVELPTQVLFENPTIAELAKVLLQAMGSRENVQRIERRKRAGTCPLSFAQERLWFLDQLSSGTPLYNIVDVIHLQGRYDAAAMTSAIRELIARHEVLRTVFSYVNREPVQTILPEIDVVFTELDLSTLFAQEKELAWAQVVQRESRKSFDLSCPPLFRVTVVYWADQEQRLLLTIHHIIADEWSMELIQEEVTHLYRAFAQNEPLFLTELPIQYADFACWQRDRQQAEVQKRQISYWREQLSGAQYVLELPADKPRPRVQSFRGETEIFAVPKDLLERLKLLGAQAHATLFMVLEASFATLLYRHTGQTDILIGTPISGRTHGETERLIGCFLNTVVLRSRFTDGLSFRGLLQQAREKALGAYAHPDLPFERLVAKLAPERDSSRMPLFQVMFILHNPDGISQVSKVAGNRELHTGTSKFDLTLILSECETGLEGLIEYSTDLFEADTIRHLCGHYRELLNAIAHDPDQSISKLPMLTETERRQLLVEWNNTGVTYPGLCLHQLVEEQAQQTPNEVAVVCRAQSLTYADLDRRANQLAHRLLELGVGPDVQVGLFVERSLEMVVGLLGILKAGGAYVPLDPSFPPHRLAYMVGDSRMTVLLTHHDLAATLPDPPPMIVRLDSDWSDMSRQSALSEGLPQTCQKNLAYVLYTSGSTGKPKGVAISHRALVNFLTSMRSKPGLDPHDILLSVTTISFDIFGLEVWLPLTIGAKVVIASKETSADGRRLAELIASSGTTVMQATPSTWRLLLDSGWEGDRGLKVLCGGEAWSKDLANRLLPKCSSLWNMYGPTETTIWSSVYQVTSSSPVVIGPPIANTQFYVVDSNLQAVPMGVAGELLIGGDSLADGYLNRPELTAEKFIANPFQQSAGSRVYCTGDLVRYLPSGTIEFLTRIDQQVKVRGYRIELGEIESVLRTHPGVKRSVVAVWGEGEDKELVAYVVPANSLDTLLGELRILLREKLPDYMVPGAFVLLSELPLTLNGKVDRKSLPAPRGKAQTGMGYVAPRTEIEKALARLWAEILGVERVGIRDNFFELGGHSLKAVTMVSGVEDMIGQRLSPASLMAAPTIQQFAELIQRTQDLRRTKSQVADMAEITQQVRQFIEETYPPQSGGTLADSDSLLERGIIDETEVLQLVAFLEDTFGITVTDEDLVPNNLGTIRNLSTFVSRSLCRSHEKVPVEATP